MQLRVIDTHRVTLRDRFRVYRFNWEFVTVSAFDPLALLGESTVRRNPFRILILAVSSALAFYACAAEPTPSTPEDQAPLEDLGRPYWVDCPPCPVGVALYATGEGYTVEQATESGIRQLMDQTDLIALDSGIPMLFERTTLNTEGELGPHAAEAYMFDLYDAVRSSAALIEQLHSTIWRCVCSSAV